MKCPEQVNPQRQKVVWWLSRAGESGLGESEVTANGYGASFLGGGGSKMIIVVELCEYTKSH